MLFIFKLLRRRDFLILSTMMVFTFILYYPSLFYDFIYSLDDGYALEKIEAINSQYGLFKGILSLFINIDIDVHYTPISFVSLLIDYHIWGINPYMFRLHNLIIHLLCGVSLYIFLNRLTKKRFIALLVAFIFLIHPLNIEAVVWATSGRRQVLFLLFFLLSLIFYLESLYNKKRFFYILSLLFIMLSLASKTSAISYPFITALIYLVIKGKITKELFYHILLSSGIVFVFIIPNLFLIELNSLQLQREFLYSNLDHVFFIGYSYFSYWYKTFFPYPLSFFYPLPSEHLTYLPIPYYFFTGITFIIVGLIIFHIKKKQWLFFFALAYYTICIGPQLDFILLFKDIPMVSPDRYYYHSGIGILLYISLWVDNLFKNKGEFLKLLIVIITIYLVFLFKFQLPNWIDDITLLKNNVNYYPSEEFYYRLAIELHSKNKEEAFYYMEQADRLGTEIWFNNTWFFYLQKAFIYFDKGDYNNSLKELNKVISKNPDKEILKRVLEKMKKDKVANPNNAYYEIMSLKVQQ